MTKARLAEPLRVCIRCGVEKELNKENFRLKARLKSGFEATCCDCWNAREREWYQSRIADPQKAARKREQWRRAAASRRANGHDTSAEWKAANPERVRENRRKWLERNPKWRVSYAMSRRLRDAIRSQKAGRPWESIVGYSVDELVRHLERQFAKGMSWDNYGSHWEIDHIVPVKEFAITGVACDELRACWALSNLRPLEMAKNRQKSGRRELLV